jgi:hypothetical protein
MDEVLGLVLTCSLSARGDSLFLRGVSAAEL